MDRRARAVLIVVSGAIFLEGIDVSMMGVALPPIRAELGLSTADLQWVVSAYVLGYGGFVLLGGRAADLLGRRRMFLCWLAVFVAFSGLGGLASDGWVLIAARFATGVAAGFLTPAGLSIITTMFPEGSPRNQALLVYAGIASGGFSLGLVVGGLLSAISWRWVFFAPVLMAIVILVAAVRLIPHDRHPERGEGGLDLLGAGLLVLAMLVLVLGVVRSPDMAVATSAGTLGAGAVLLVAFAAVERRATDPLIRFGILRSAALVRANAGAMLLVGSFVGFQFIAVLYLQELRGWSELETGLALLVVGIDAVLAPTVTPRLVNRFGAREIAVVGLVLATVAYAMLLPLGLDWSYAALLPSLLLLGLAFALAYGPLTILATDGVEEREQGLAGGILTMSFQFGSALGLAVVSAVIVAVTGPDASPGAQLDGFRTAMVVPLVAGVLGVIATSAARRRQAPVGVGEEVGVVSP